MTAAMMEERLLWSEPTEEIALVTGKERPSCHRPDNKGYQVAHLKIASVALGTTDSRLIGRSLAASSVAPFKLWGRP